MLPSAVQTLEQQKVQAYGQFLSKESRLEKRIFLHELIQYQPHLILCLNG